MKKILVVLLILAVAGGVFAQQGNWSLGAGGNIGARVNFAPNEGVDTDYPVLVRGSGWFRAYDWYTGINATLNIGYSRDIVNVGIDFDTADAFGAGLTINGDNYTFSYYGNPTAFFVSSDYDGLLNSSGHSTFYSSIVGRLWGTFNLLNGLVNLEAAYNSRDTEYWYSDKTGMFSKDGPYTLGGDFNSPTAIADPNWTNATGGLFWDPGTFTSVDHHTYLLVDLNLANFSAGILIPNVFATEISSDFDNGFNDGYSGFDGTPYLTELGGHNFDSGLALVDDALKRLIFGAKFDMSPIEFAAQFLMKDYGAYFGGKFFAGPVTVGLSFSGIFGSDDTESNYMRFGGSLGYNAGAFGAGLRAFYGKVDYAADGAYQTIIGIEPNFFYNVIPSHLGFTLNAGFYFTNDVTNNEDDKNVVWAVQPELIWNFQGTGAATSYWGFSTGMLFRYRVVSEAVSALDVVFKFGL